MSIKQLQTVNSGLSASLVLRRYLDVTKFIDLLKNQSLYLCRADLFQDKFEGSFTPSLRGAIDEAYKTNNIDFNYEKFKRELREGVYVNCWSLGVHDNMALWKLYGKSDASVAVTTTVSRLRKAITNWDPSEETTLSKVEYINHWRDPAISIEPYSNVFRYKVIAYDFEREVRIIHDKLEQNFKQDKKESGIHMKVDLNELLRSIVVSPTAKPWFFDLVNDIAKKYGIKTPVKYSALATDPI